MKDFDFDDGTIVDVDIDLIESVFHSCCSMESWKVQPHRLSSIILDNKGKFLVHGANIYCKSHPLQHRFALRVKKPDKVFLHAEVHGLVRALKCDRLPHTMIIVRYMRGKQRYGMSKPCVVCQEALNWSPLKNVIYFDGRNWIGVSRPI